MGRVLADMANFAAESVVESGYSGTCKNHGDCVVARYYSGEKTATLTMKPEDGERKLSHFWEFNCEDSEAEYLMKKLKVKYNLLGFEIVEDSGR